jgi:hypothetical protein
LEAALEGVGVHSIVVVVVVVAAFEEEVEVEVEVVVTQVCCPVASHASPELSSPLAVCSLLSSFPFPSFNEDNTDEEKEEEKEEGEEDVFEAQGDTAIQYGHLASHLYTPRQRVGSLAEAIIIIVVVVALAPSPPLSSSPSPPLPSPSSMLTRVQS